MRLVEPIVKKGCFYLPNNKSEMIWGALTIENKGLITLRLDENFEKWKCDTNLNIPKILGHSFSPLELITLNNCYPSENPIDGTTSDNLLHANTTFIGFQFEEDEEIKIDSMKFSFEGIETWTRNNHALNKVLDGQLSNTEHEHLVLNTYELDNRMELDFVFSNSINNEKIFSHFILRAKQSFSFSSFLEYLNHLNTFFHLTTNNFTSTKDVSITNPNAINSKGSPIWVSTYFGSMNCSAIKKDGQSNNFLLPSQFVSDKIENLLKSWFANYREISLAFLAYILSKSDEHIYFQDQYLKMVQAHEKYITNKYKPKYKQGALKENLPDKINELRNVIPIQFEEQILTEDEAIKQYAKLLPNTRNDYVHLKEGKERKGITNNRKLSRDFRFLDCLFKFYFLQEIGLSNDEIKDLYEKSPDMQRIFQNLTIPAPTSSDTES